MRALVALLVLGCASAPPPPPTAEITDWAERQTSGNMEREVTLLLVEEAEVDGRTEYRYRVTVADTGDVMVGVLRCHFTRDERLECVMGE